MATTPRPTTSTVLDALDDALLEIRRLVRRPGYLHRLLTRLDRPVDTSALRVLRAVERATPPPPTVGDVARRLDIDPSTASRLVDQQVAAGYVTRDRCAEDRRRSRLALTPTGRSLLDEVTLVRRELLAEATTGWDEDELGALVALLTRLRSGFDRIEAEA